ncbi:hypothetical protein F3K02_18260 [Hydrogenophaga sp. D2P1]|uniref:Uncharacterized protein n=1 Tax=Hydrogenophaga aromaticivorans TaxID=2610898 RepID=A0A7Y8GYF1_9BURK|nr:hypothetical protein [Hydrogenophaga aromaticivorans]NWF47179.1 hypothetical protein [Hydrogenophaga aromaticivorans]
MTSKPRSSRTTGSTVPRRLLKPAARKKPNKQPANPGRRFRKAMQPTTPAIPARRTGSDTVQRHHLLAQGFLYLDPAYTDGFSPDVMDTFWGEVNRYAWTICLQAPHDVFDLVIAPSDLLHSLRVGQPSADPSPRPAVDVESAPAPDVVQPDADAQPDPGPHPIVSFSGLDGIVLLPVHEGLWILLHGLNPDVNDALRALAGQMATPDVVGSLLPQWMELSWTDSNWPGSPPGECMASNDNCFISLLARPDQQATPLDVRQRFFVWMVRTQPNG